MSKKHSPAAAKGRPSPSRPQAQQRASEFSRRAARSILTAQEFERLEQLLPGATERVLKMAEENQRRRLASEEGIDKANQRLAAANAEAVEASARASDAANSEAARAQWMAYSIVWLFLLASFALAWQGREIAASVLGGGVLLAMVVSFLKRKADD